MKNLNINLFKIFVLTMFLYSCIRPDENKATQRSEASGQIIDNVLMKNKSKEKSLITDEKNVDQYINDYTKKRLRGGIDSGDKIKLLLATQSKELHRCIEEIFKEYGITKDNYKQKLDNLNKTKLTKSESKLKEKCKLYEIYFSKKDDEGQLTPYACNVSSLYGMLQNISPEDYRYITPFYLNSRLKIINPVTILGRDKVFSWIMKSLLYILSLSSDKNMAVHYRESIHLFNQGKLETGLTHELVRFFIDNIGYFLGKKIKQPIKCDSIVHSDFRDFVIDLIRRIANGEQIGMYIYKGIWGWHFFRIVGIKIDDKLISELTELGSVDEICKKIKNGEIKMDKIKFVQYDNNNQYAGDIPAKEIENIKVNVPWLLRLKFNYCTPQRDVIGSNLHSLKSLKYRGNNLLSLPPQGSYCAISIAKKSNAAVSSIKWPTKSSFKMNFYELLIVMVTLLLVILLSI